jgi:hypothetical protein
MNLSKRSPKFFLVIAFKVTACAAIIFYLIKSDRFSPGDAINAFLAPSLFLPLFFTGVAFSVVKAVRTLILFKSFSVSIKFAESLKIVFTSYYFDLFGIGQIGGVFSKFYFLQAVNKDKKLAITSAILIEVILITLFMLVTGGVLFFHIVPGANRNAVFASIIFAVALATAVIIVAFIVSYFFKNWPLLRWQNSSWPAILSSVTPKLGIAIFSLTAVVFWLKTYSLFLAASELVPGLAINFSQLYSIFAIGGMVSVLPIGISGLGAGHLGFDLVAQNLFPDIISFGANLYMIFWLQNLSLAGVGAIVFFVCPPGKAMPSPAISTNIRSS